MATENLEHTGSIEQQIVQRVAQDIDGATVRWWALQAALTTRNSRNETPEDLVDAAQVFEAYLTGDKP